MATTRKAPQGESPRDLMLQVARIQLASITAASRFLAGWAQASDRYVQGISDELRARVQGEKASTELAAGLATVSTEHLHELTALPNIAVRHFNRELTAKSDLTPKGKKS